MYLLRRASEADIDEIMTAIEDARVFLAAQGIDQWPRDRYPLRRDIEEDVAQGIGWAYCDGDGVAAYFALDTAPEPCYADITGAWLTSGSYATLHRTAVAAAHRGRGLGGRMLEAAAQTAADMGEPALRVDTHADNAIMLHLLEKHGYKYCGTVIYDNYALRVAYEKLL